MPAGVQQIKPQTQQAFSGGLDFSPLSGLADTIAGNIQKQRAADALAMQNAQPGQGIPGAVGPTSVGGPQGPTPLQPSTLSPLSSILNTIFPSR